MPPKEKRGNKNEWKPQKRDLELIIQQRANGMTNALIARHHGVSGPTLKKHAAHALSEGKELHEGVLLSQMASLGRQTANPQTAFNAIKWQLSALHGYSDQTGQGDNDQIDADEERNAAFESARAKLAPYLAIDAAARMRIEGTMSEDSDTGNTPAE